MLLIFSFRNQILKHTVSFNTSDQRQRKREGHILPRTSVSAVNTASATPILKTVTDTALRSGRDISAPASAHSPLRNFDIGKEGTWDPVSGIINGTVGIIRTVRIAG